MNLDRLYQMFFSMISAWYGTAEVPNSAGADVSVWQEITDAKKQEIEAQWQAEMEAEMEVQSGEE